MKMAGELQRRARHPAGRRRGAAVAFGGGLAAVVKADYRPGTRTLLRAGERVKIVDEEGKRPAGDTASFVYAFREGSAYGRRVPSSYFEVVGSSRRGRG